MSEISEEKSKRKYLHFLQSYQWSYQYSLFYEDIYDSKSLLNEMVRFKQELRRMCPDQPFLIRIQLRNGKTLNNPEGGTQAYLTIFTTTKAQKAIDAATDKAMSTPTNIMSRRISPEALAFKASRIKSQKPHNLEQFFGKKKINRFTVLNKSKLFKHQETTNSE